MYEKIKKINKTFWDDINPLKVFFVLWIILFLLTVISYTVKQEWSTVLTYPKKDYQALEDEAKKMANTHNLETDYECTYTYNNITNSLSLALKNVNRDGISITATISDYNTDKQNISITRICENKAEFIIKIFITHFIFIPAFLALVIEIIIIVILGLTYLIAFIFHKIRENFLKIQE